MTNKPSELTQVIAAIENLDATENKKEAQQNENVVQDYISATKLRANLLHGNYEAALRLTAPIFSERKGDPYEVPHLGIIISLLARLKKARGENRLNTFEYPDASMQELHNLVDSLIATGGLSPNSAIAIIRNHTSKKTTSLRVA